MPTFASHEEVIRELPPSPALTTFAAGWFVPPEFTCGLRRAMDPELTVTASRQECATSCSALPRSHDSFTTSFISLSRRVGDARSRVQMLTVTRRDSKLALAVD
jgi:hypothetical protein